METIYNYNNAQSALKELKNKGYTIDYNIKFEEIEAEAEHFVIDYLYRYEGMSNPSDESSVYGIKHINGDRKGVFVAGNLSFIEGKQRDIIIALEIKAKQTKHY